MFVLFDFSTGNRTISNRNSFCIFLLEIVSKVVPNFALFLLQSIPILVFIFQTEKHTTDSIESLVSWFSV